MEESGSVTWQHRLERFIENQKKLFGKNSSFEAECKLTELRQITSVSNYQTDFEFWSRRATKMHELILISLFISGLKPEIRWELQLNRPTSLKEAFASALFHGSRLEGLKLAMKKVDDELTSSESYRKDIIIDEFADSSVETNIVETLVSEVESKIDVPKINSVLQVEDVDEGKLMSFASKVVHPHRFEEITPTNDLFSIVVSELIDFSQGSLLINGDGGDMVLHRRRVVFKFYMLEEVYRESLSLHLEDKVVLQDGRVDTTLDINYFIINCI